MGRAKVYTLVGEELYAPGDMLPASPADKAEPKQRARDEDPDGTGDPDADPGAGDEAGYLVWTLKELKAEIAQRNAERDEDAHLSVKGNKAALIATLEADDVPSEDVDEDPDGTGDPDADPESA